MCGSNFMSVLFPINLRVDKRNVRVLNKPQVLVFITCRKLILIFFVIALACKMFLIPQHFRR